MLHLDIVTSVFLIFIIFASVKSLNVELSPTLSTHTDANEHCIYNTGSKYSLATPEYIQSSSFDPGKDRSWVDGKIYTLRKDCKEGIHHFIHLKHVPRENASSLQYICENASGKQKSYNKSGCPKFMELEVLNTLLDWEFVYDLLESNTSYVIQGIQLESCSKRCLALSTQGYEYVDCDTMLKPVCVKDDLKPYSLVLTKMKENITCDSRESTSVRDEAKCHIRIDSDREFDRSTTGIFEDETENIIIRVVSVTVVIYSGALCIFVYKTRE